MTRPPNHASHSVGTSGAAHSGSRSTATTMAATTASAAGREADPIARAPPPRNALAAAMPGSRSARGCAAASSTTSWAPGAREEMTRNAGSFSLPGLAATSSRPQRSTWPSARVMVRPEGIEADARPSWATARKPVEVARLKFRHAGTPALDDPGIEHLEPALAQPRRQQPALLDHRAVEPARAPGSWPRRSARIRCRTMG